MNKNKYDSLDPAQRKVIDDAVAWFEQDNPSYTAEKTKETLDLQDKAGIKVVDFGPEFKKTAVELYWDDLKQLSPDSIGKLQPSSTKPASDARRTDARPLLRHAPDLLAQRLAGAHSLHAGRRLDRRMTIGISAEVILRMFDFPSIIGLIELTEYGLFISTFFAAPHLLRTNEHIRVDIVMSRVDPATARVSSSACSAASSRCR